MPDETERDPLAGFDSIAEHLAFWNKNQGAAFVQELLALMSTPPVPAEPWRLSQAERVGITTRATLEDAALELDSRGLRKLAKTVRAHAMDRPREIDIPPYEPGTVNHTAWMASRKHRRRGCSRSLSDTG